MADDFFSTALGTSGIRVCRLGLSGTYFPGKKTIFTALDEGINYFFCYGFDRQMISVLRDLSRSSREKYVVATGAYNLLIGHTDIRRTLEKRLRQLRTDYIDFFMFLGVINPKNFGERVREEMRKLKEEGKVRYIGMSCHDRTFAGKLASQGELDMFMIRYNAAHRGAEKDIFPHLAKHNPAVVSYTATRWRSMLRKPKTWQGNRIPSAGMCYRFVLSNPCVNVCMTAPSNLKQLKENLSAFRQGALSQDEMKFMKEFGDVVYKESKSFIPFERMRKRAPTNESINAHT
jgi:aryl-alcohol dehydrogenase-like predicted oxidoreductase